MAVVPFGGERLPVKLPKGPWKVLPCNKQKRPLTPHGVHDATDDKDKIAAWWTRWPEANIGAAMGEPSGLWCLDVDPRNGGAQSLEILQDETDPWPVTWHVRTGGGGEHFYFRLPPGVSVPNCKPMAGIDVLCTGKYTILPPSMHQTGVPYDWYIDESPDEIECAYAPPSLLALIGATSDRVKDLEPPESVNGVRITQVRIDEINSALAFIDADDREVWLRVGMACHHESPDKTGFDLWRAWSQGSDKFDPVDQRKTWYAFRRSRDADPVTMDTVFQLALSAGWPGAPAVEIDLSLGVNPSTGEITDDEDAVPVSLMQIPGLLNELVAYDLRTAPRPNPQLAIQGALAFGSAAISRRFVTDRRNHASLYFLSVAKSGTGKEHARNVIQRAMLDCKLGLRLGGAGYASGSGVYSALEDRPAQIGMIDELGRQLQTNNKSQSEHRISAITALMEAYGRADGIMMPVQYSTRGLSAEQKSQLQQKHIECPNLTLLAATTPQTFYASLSDNAVHDGFLPRFIVVESVTEREPMRAPSREPLPELIIDWAEALAQRVHGDDLVSRSNETDAQVPPPLVVVPFSEDAVRVFERLERRVIDQQDELDAENLAELLNRTVENAMRLSLIVALSRDPDTSSIDDIAATWACEYVEHYANQTVKAFKEQVVASEFGAWKLEARRIVERADANGVTARDVKRLSRVLRDLPERQFNEVMQGLCAEEVCVFTTIKTTRGPGRKAWVSTKFTQKSET